MPNFLEANELRCVLLNEWIDKWRVRAEQTDVRGTARSCGQELRGGRDGGGVAGS